MNNLSSLDVDFFKLNKEPNNTLAYWIFALTQNLDLKNGIAAKYWSEMSIQYDAEDQSLLGEEDVFGNPQLVQQKLKLFSPIQLTLQWSPFPFAEMLFGVPTFIDIDDQIYSPAAMAVWERPIFDFSIKAKNKFEKRFRELAKHSSILKCPLALVGARGFCYENRKLSRNAKRAVRHAGFILNNRAP